MTTGEAITRWTIRVSLLLCAAAAASYLQASHRARSGGPARERFSAARWCWSLGWIVYLLHVAAAFHYYHDWSHRRAWEHTAARTYDVFAIRSGSGIWFNYALTIAWTIDVLRIWRRPRGRELGGIQPSSWLVRGWYAWFAAMALFATVVFETGWTRWIALATFAALAATAIYFGRAAPSQPSSTAQQATK